MILSDNFRKVKATYARGHMADMAAASPAAPKGLPPEDPQALQDCATNLVHEGKYPEARVSFERLVAMTEAAHGPEHPQVAVALNQLAQVLSAWATSPWPDRRPSAP